MVVTDDNGLPISSTGGTSTGGGNNVWSNVAGDFTATANSGAKTVTLSTIASVLSAILATKNFAGASIKRISSGGAVDSLPMTNVSYSAGVLTLSDMAANFAVGDTVAVFLPGPDKSYDEVNDAMKSIEQFGPQAEDNVNNVFGIMPRPVTSGTYAPTNYQNAGTVTKANIKASAASVFSIRITNANAAIRYLQLHNKATAPAAADTAQLYFLIPAGTATQPTVVELGMDWFSPSEFFATGLGWAISTTATTFTDSATAADHNVKVRYL
jgi:hypothetical protein